MLVPAWDAGSAPIFTQRGSGERSGSCLFGAQVLLGCSFVMSAVVPLSLSH